MINRSRIATGLRTIAEAVSDFTEKVQDGLADIGWGITDGLDRAADNIGGPAGPVQSEEPTVGQMREAIVNYYFNHGYPRTANAYENHANLAPSVIKYAYGKLKREGHL